MKKLVIISALFPWMCSCLGPAPNRNKVLDIIERVNTCWQMNNVPEARPFWDNAIYHSGNMEVYYLTGDKRVLEYTKRWAEHNNYCGATSDEKEKWVYSYGESPEHVLFGNWQLCFQIYADLYCFEPDTIKIARAREVLEYQMSTPDNEYWWWADALYMVMPVMTTLYHITGNQLYLDKSYEYFKYAKSVMYDERANLFYRDAKYVYPNHTTNNGQKDFWARGNGGALAGLAKMLNELPSDDEHRDEYVAVFVQMSEAVKACQQPEGYWTRSMLDEEHAPGPETSGTAFLTYGLLWGINNGLLDRVEYWPVVEKSWNYLSTVALHPDGCVGYVQLIGERAIPGQIIDVNSTANFGVGAFLLAACEMVRYIDAH